MEHDKVDLKRTHPGYRAKQGEFEVITLPTVRVLAVDGSGDPNTSSEFTRAIEALYPAAYALKFLSKRELGRDYVVPPLEGLWWADDPSAFIERRKAEWSWTLMIMIPEWLADADVARALSAGAQKAGPAAPKVHVRELAEGACVQTLHTGSFDDEGPVLARMHNEIIPALGLQLAGTHHEVYLSDFRRVTPEKRRTILRQPVAPKSG